MKYILIALVKGFGLVLSVLLCGIFPFILIASPYWFIGLAIIFLEVCCFASCCFYSMDKEVRENQKK